ncbi:MAG: vWA domain-containing protein [Fimbriiglobus sp.]
MAGPVSRQLPSTITAEEFGEVNVTDTPTGRGVRFTILMEPQGQDAEGWQTGVALDASASMKNWYGRSLIGKIPPEIVADYVAKGWVTERISDGKRAQIFDKEAYGDAIAKGHVKFTQNVVEPAAREFISYLAANLDADGGTTVLYWACGDGDAIEEVGDLTADQCKTLTLTGPTTKAFGNGTKLTPAFRYFADRFRDAKNGMYVFLTDGKLDDLPEAKAYTVQLCQEIAAGTRNPLKCVLIGVGDKIDETQMEELDDLDSGTEVDIWDHKIAADMRGIQEIFAEVVSENTIVAPTGILYGPDGAAVVRFADGVPAIISATLPANAAFFELEVAGRRIRQPLV